MVTRTILFILIIFNNLVFGFLLYGQSSSSNGYRSAIANADEYFEQEDYVNAKTSYQYASRLIPEEQYPKDRLRETVDKLREKMALMEGYTAVITEADNYYRNKEYDEAIEKFRQAAQILPSEDYPEEKIKEIEYKKDEKRRQQIAYDDAIYRADKFVKYKKYEQAIASYKKASEILPEESYPRERTAELEMQLEALVEARNAYESIIDNADRLYALKYYQNAKEEYQKAAEARPEDDYPKSMLAEVEQLLVKKNEFDKLVEEGDEHYMNRSQEAAKKSYQHALKIYPAESYPKDMISKINAALKDQVDPEELYADAIASADNFLAAADYTNAMQEYENASGVKPEESYPQQKIDEINAILEARKAGEEAYAAAVKRGDQYLNAGSYAEAKTEFDKALELKPEESYPAERLAVVMKNLQEKEVIMASYQQSVDKANAFVDEREYDKAMAEFQNALIIIPGDQYATDKIKELERVKATIQENGLIYSQLLADGDKLFTENDLVAAREKYGQALELDESQVYPAEKIAGIDQQLNDQRELNAAYNKAIATADIYFNNQEYNRAKAEYEKAGALKPNESYPKNRIGKISVVAIAATQQNDKYTETIREADGLMGLQEYAKAKLVYIKASNMRPKEQYPKDKMLEIDAILSREEADQVEYNRLIAAADRMMESENYETARERYTQALELAPTEEYPSEKLNEIAGIILATELDVQKAYNTIIAEADLSFDQKNYEAATIKYQNALKYKPGEDYPVQRLAEIERLAADLKKLQDQYSRLIAEADNLFTSKEFQEAKPKYIAASALFPDKEHPKKRIEEINLKYKSANQNALLAYDKTIADADKFFSAGTYGKAMDSYRKANGLMPDESYPEEMISKIRKILSDNAVRKLVTASKSIQKNEVEKFSFDPISVADRKSSILFVRVRGMGIRDFKVFVSYGRGGSKNGGFIMPIPAGGEFKEYIFELENQYSWFSKDNNWISLTPQGGSIEVTLIEIVKAGGEN